MAERILLAQAANWFLHKSQPIEDHLYRSAPTVIDNEDPHLRELYLILRKHKCDLQGWSTVNYTVEHEGEQGNLEQPFNHYRVDIGKFRLQDIDFNKSSAVEVLPRSVEEVAQGSEPKLFPIVDMTLDFDLLRQAVVRENDQANNKKSMTISPSGGRPGKIEPFIQWYSETDPMQVRSMTNKQLARQFETERQDSIGERTVQRAKAAMKRRQATPPEGDKTD